MTHAVASFPLSAIAGKDFENSWEIAEAATGPASSLADVGAVEFRASKTGLPEQAVVWSIETGHIEIIGDEMVLRVPGAETEDLTVGQWSWLLSYGATEAETPLVTGMMHVTAEP